MTTSAMMGSAAPPHNVEFGGKVYAFRRMDQAAQAAFTASLTERLRAAAAFAFRDQPEMLRAELKQLAADCACDYYAFLGEFVQGKPEAVPETREVDGQPVEGHVTRLTGGWLRTPVGTLTLVRILAGCADDDEARRLMVGAPEQVHHALDVVLTESFSGMGSPPEWKPGPPPKN